MFQLLTVCLEDSYKVVMEEAIAEVKKAVTVGRTDVLNTVLENCHKCKLEQDSMRYIFQVAK